MSYNNFNRGRGFGPRGNHRFGRPRFVRPPFRHVGPPRQGYPASFGMPWQQNNMYFQPHPVRGTPQFRADNRRRRFNYDVRFPAPNKLPIPPNKFYEEIVEPVSSIQMETDQDETVPQLPLLGSEEERQQKITETADRLKQKLSSFSSDEMVDIWSEDIPSAAIEDDCIENNRPIPVVGYKSSELSLTYNDLRDIGKINPDNTKPDNIQFDSEQHPTDMFNIMDNDVILDENENGSQLMIPSDEMTNLENAPDDNVYTEINNWELQEPIDHSHNLEQSDLPGDNNIELLESDLQYQYDMPPANFSDQDQIEQQQDTSQEIGIYPQQDTSQEIGMYPQQNTSQEIGIYPQQDTSQEIGIYPEQDTLQVIGIYPQQDTAQEIGIYPQQDTSQEIGIYPQQDTSPEIGIYPQQDTSPEIGIYPQQDISQEIEIYPQQDTSQEIGIYPTDTVEMNMAEQEEPETLDLQTASFPIDSVDQDILQKEDEQRPQNEGELYTNSEVQESVLNSHVHAESSNSSNNMLTQPALADVSVNNVALDNQLPRGKENSFHSGPPQLSPHTEQELPVDFDPTTPPPILLKQDQPRVMPPYSVPPDLPPLFDPTAPPPNMQHLLGSNMPHEDANPAWSNAQNPMSAVYENIEVHTGLNTHGGFMLQQLPLEISNQNNAFLPSHIDSVNYSPMYPMPSTSSGINTHVPSMLPQMHVVPHNTYVPSSSLPELSPSSDLPCNVNKDDVLDDLQEAMRFAKEMTNITGKADEKSKSFSKNNISINPINDVESIALPPGKPKTRTNKLKKIKENDTCSKKKIEPKEQNTKHYLFSEETRQDANEKSKDVSLMKEQDRPKVVFNLNNKTKVVKTARQENNEKKNGITQFMESEKMHVASAAIKKDSESTLKRNKEEEKNLKKKENISENTMSFALIANQDALPRKKPQKDIRMEKSRSPSISLYSKVNVKKSKCHIEKNENTNSNIDVSWKNKIISRFLKMSKNDIYNMVNNTSLRKFDIIMKRLVKEKRPTLSLEMRHAQDEKMKLYDQQEFMKQLNAMLDTDAIVSITDLPTEFIHHLNEVLQLDVQPDNPVEPAVASSSQYHQSVDQSENINYTLNPIIHTTECANKTIPNNDEEYVRNKSHTTKAPHNKDIQTYNTRSNDLHLKDDTCNTTITSDPSISNLLTLQHDLDDIFSEVTKKNQIPAAVKERKRCSIGQQNTKKLDIDAISESVEKEALLEDDRVCRLENYPRWDEKCDRWKRKERDEREDPYAYRNLTKEEWEARYGTQAISAPSFNVEKIIVNNKKSSSRGRGKKLYPRRRYSSESSKNPPNTRHRSLEKDKHKKSRRHSDDRRHSTEYLEHTTNPHSNSSSNGSSSSSSSSSSSTNSSDNTNVTKLLRVIKENEKVAKKMSLNEAIRDEVNAEIERERKTRKSRKKSSKNRKPRKEHYKRKKKQSRRMMRSSNSSSEKDDSEETTDRLLTESEIKKEIVENQITQEVIVKEEVDIGASQEENTEDVFANAPSFAVENNKAGYSFASQGRLRSPLTQEISLATVNATTHLHAEDRLPTASPTQPKTKAQLKQMPETSDMNDNKVPLNVITCIPENWNTFNPANISESTEDLNRACQTTDACSQDKATPSTIDSFTSETDNVAHVSCGEAKTAIPDTTVCAVTESSSKMQDTNETPVTHNDVSRTVATSATISSVPPANTMTQKQKGSKKIDIKTYYERTIQRRMNEKLESKKPVENAATSTREDSLTSKATESKIVADKSAFVPTHSGSLQDPRLASARSAVIPTNNKDDAQTTIKRNLRQKEKRTTKESTIAELTPRRSEEKNSSRIVDSDKKINQDKSKDKVSLAVSNISAPYNVAATSKTAVLRSKKSLENKKSVIDKESQSDAKRFKHIRSEGSKELKLKKELAKEQKRKKPAAASKSTGLVLTKVYFPSEEATRVEKLTQEKKTDNISNVNKTEVERLQSTGSRENEINNGNTRTEPPTISSENTDNDGSALSQDTVKTKDYSPSFNILDQGNAEKPVSNIEGVDAREQSSKATLNKGTPHMKHAKNIVSVETAKEDQNARAICNVVPKLDGSTASKNALKVPESKILSEIEKISEKDFSTSKTQQPDATKDKEPSSSNTDQSQIKKSNDQDLLESTINRDTSNISDTIDKQSKEDQVLINSDVKINNTKENNMELDILGDTQKSANAKKDRFLAKKTARLSSNENSNDSHGRQGVISSDSTGSPFQGFLQETMIEFQQPSLFNLKLDEIDATKKNKIFLDDCNLNYKDMKIDGRQEYETLESGKRCAASEKGNAGNKSDLSTDESREGNVTKSSSEIIATTLHDENNDINIDGGGETERQLMSKEGYTSCAGLVIKESMFINEEDIQAEARSKDLASKLKTTTDPSLSDALETTTLDDTLRLPESQGADHLDNHMYLETNISTEKTPCDKLPSFGSDEHLDNDIFYLDDRLRGATTFDNKDDESVHFPVHQPSLQYDIVPSEPAMIASCANLSKSEGCKFDLKHISSMDGDLLAVAPMEHSPTDTPKMLNIPTKAALKEATNIFLKAPANVRTTTKEAALRILQKAQQSEADLNYRTSTWHVDEQNNIKTLEARNDTTAQDFVNINTISSMQSTYDEPVSKDIDVNHDTSVTPSTDIEKRLHSIKHCNPVVELKKMKELDKLLEKRSQKESKKTKEMINEGHKKHNGTILHKLKDKRRMKYQSKGSSNRNSLVKRLKKMKDSGRIAGNTKEAILARMLEIDLEMQKLLVEKLKLHEMLQSNIVPAENSVANSSVIPNAKEDDTADDQSKVPTMLVSLLRQSDDLSHAKQAKHTLSPKPSIKPSIKPSRKRPLPRNSENNIMNYTPVHQKTKTPVIRWKKMPRLELTMRREEDANEEEEDLDETTEKQTSTSVSKVSENDSNDVSENIQKSNAVVDHEAQEKKTTEKSDKQDACDNDSGHAICSEDKSTTDKSAEDCSKLQDLAEGEIEPVKSFDIDKQNDIPSSEAAKTNSQSSSKQIHSTPEPLSIYSDDSMWDSLVQNTASEMHENKKATGFVLLNETLKKELARSQKMKALVRKKKKEQLDTFLKSVNNLTMEEDELPLSQLYIKKLRQKRDLLDSLSQKKEDADLMSNNLNVINAVAKNREDVYEPQSEARASDDIPTTSKISVLQPDKHQFYVDAEANANSDWPSREKENVEEVALQQDSNDIPGTDGSNHVFKAVSQDKVPFYDEPNGEPDSSITPEETLIESHSSNCERDRSKDDNNTTRNFDIKVSVSKTLIKDDFGLELQKLKGTEDSVVGAGLVDSTTNTFSINSERLEEKDKNSQNISQAVTSIVDEDKKNEDEATDKHAEETNEKEETVVSKNNEISAPQSNAVRSGYSENEESADSVASNQYDKTAIKDTERDSSVSNSTVEKADTKQKKLDAESEQLSNDASIALKQECQNMENAAAKEEEKSNPENKSHAFDKILDHDQSTGSPVPVDVASERSEESNEVPVEQKSDQERTLTSTFSFNKATAKSEEPSTKLRRKYNSSTPVRRSTRNSSDVKSNRIKEADANSNSSERESNVPHERNLTISRSSSNSPTSAMRDGKITNNGRKNRVAPKARNNIRRKVGAKSKTKVEDPVKHFNMIAETAVSNNSTVGTALKRKLHTESQMKDCKVRLIDCKSSLLKYVNPGVLDKFGITAVNPCAPSDSSCMQRTTSIQNVIIPTATSGKNFFFSDKPSEKPDIEILEEKPTKESSDKDLAQESVSQAAGISEEEAAKMQYTVHKGPILDIKIFENSFLAASEDGKIYRYSQISSGILNIYKGHKSAVTCLYICKSDVAGVNKELMYSGSLDGTLCCYNIMTGELIKNPAQVNSPIQCMDQAWGTIFIGTKSGHVSRFHIKTGVIKGNSISFSDKSVLALKATNEGARRILIVASRSQPITIRDAQTGLFLRTISGQKNHTVYSLLRHNNLIYCGTSSRSINVFDFTTGEQTVQYDAGVGIVCMRLYKQLLFAGCYDGNIYVFNINNHKLVCSIHGPGNMLLSIEVVNNKIIAGSKDKRLHLWQMPTQVRALL